LTNGWRQRWVESANPGTPAAVVNFIIWLAVLAIVLLMAVSTAG
jgi:hypothetical protein